MDERGSLQVTQAITAELLRDFRSSPEQVAVVGVAGGVASGKSRFVARLSSTFGKVLPAKVVPLPFDLWIKQENLAAPTYHGRFFMEELQQALRSISTGTLWFCPRHDLMKHADKRTLSCLTYETAEVSWCHGSFRKVSSVHTFQSLEGSSGVYANPDTDRLYSLFLPQQGTVYIVDGTLIFQTEEMKSHYRHKVFVVGSWPDRIARMIRRFNRREVFGKANETELEYVQFLANEARCYADREIEQQLDTSMTVVGSAVETISNLLDLYRLRDDLDDQRYADAYALTLEGVNAAIVAAHGHLASVSQPELLLPLREELGNLIESKHLLAVKDIDGVLGQLAGMLMK
jgi:uridine kinase